MYKTVFRYGIYSAGLSIAYINATDHLIYHTAWGVYLGYLAIVILPIMLWLALSHIARGQDTKPSLGTLMLSGLAVALISATVYNLYTFIDVRFFDYRHLQNSFGSAVEEMKREGLPEAKIGERVEQLKEYYASPKPYLSTYVWYLVFGSVCSLIISLILQRKKTP